MIRKGLLLTIIVLLSTLMYLHPVSGTNFHGITTSFYYGGTITVKITDNTTTLEFYRGVTSQVFVNPSPTTVINSTPVTQTYSVNITLYTGIPFIPDSWKSTTGGLYVTSTTITHTFTIWGAWVYSAVYQKEFFVVPLTITTYASPYFNSEYNYTTTVTGTYMTVVINGKNYTTIFFDENHNISYTIQKSKTFTRVVSGVYTGTWKIYRIITTFTSSPSSYWTEDSKTRIFFRILYAPETITIYNYISRSTLYSKAIITYYFIPTGVWSGITTISIAETKSDTFVTLFHWGNEVFANYQDFCCIYGGVRTIIPPYPITKVTSGSTTYQETIYITFWSKVTTLPESLSVIKEYTYSSYTSGSIRIYDVTRLYSPIYTSEVITLTSVDYYGTLYPTVVFTFYYSEMYALTTKITKTQPYPLPIPITANITTIKGIITIIVHGTGTTVIIRTNNASITRTINHSLPVYYSSKIFRINGIDKYRLFIDVYFTASTIPIGWTYCCGYYEKHYNYFVFTLHNVLASNWIFADTNIVAITLNYILKYSPPITIVINGYPIISTYSSNASPITVTVSKTETGITVLDFSFTTTAQTPKTIIPKTTVVITTNITMVQSFSGNIVPSSYRKGNDGNYTFSTTFSHEFTIIDGDHNGTIASTEVLDVHGVYVKVLQKNQYTTTNFAIVNRGITIVIYLFNVLILLLILVFGLMLAISNDKKKWLKRLAYAGVAAIIVILLPYILNWVTGA